MISPFSCRARCVARVVLPLAVGPRIVISDELLVISVELSFVISNYFLQRYKKMHNAQ